MESEEVEDCPAIHQVGRQVGGWGDRQIKLAAKLARTIVSLKDTR